MAVQIQQVYKSCPSTKLVLSGYSQGGQIVHNAVGLLPAAVAGWVAKVVIFGDPGMSFFSSLLSFPFVSLRLVEVEVRCWME